MDPIRTCAWCNKPLNSQNTVQRISNITHGLCESCRIDLEYRKIPLVEVIKTLPFPVLITDSKLRVIGSNTALEQTLHKTSAEMANILPGDMLECVYADLPGGCGETEHCTACTLRDIITKTKETGKNYDRIKSYNFIKTPEGNRKVAITISTQKVGNQVLVQIEQISNE